MFVSSSLIIYHICNSTVYASFGNSIVEAMCTKENLRSPSLRCKFLIIVHSDLELQINRGKLEMNCNFLYDIQSCTNLSLKCLVLIIVRSCLQGRYRLLLASLSYLSIYLLTYSTLCL